MQTSWRRGAQLEEVATDSLKETTTLTAFIGASFGLVRFALAQNRAMSEHFVHYLEEALARQDAINQGYERALQQLTENVRDNTALLNRIVERIGEGTA